MPKNNLKRSNFAYIKMDRDFVKRKKLRIEVVEGKPNAQTKKNKTHKETEKQERAVQKFYQFGTQQKGVKTTKSKTKITQRNTTQKRITRPREQ